MVHRLEIVLAKPVPTRVLEGGEGEASKNVSAFSLEATRVIAELARSCFDDNVFIPQLAARFFALALQLVNRYTAFIEVACRRLDAGLCLLLAADIDKLLAWIESDLKCRCKSRLEGHLRPAMIPHLLI